MIESPKKGRKVSSGNVGKKAKIVLDNISTGICKSDWKKVAIREESLQNVEYAVGVAALPDNLEMKPKQKYISKKAIASNAKKTKTMEIVVSLPEKEVVKLSPTKKQTKGHKTQQSVSALASRISNSSALESGARQYELENINCKEKKILYTWHQSLIERPGVTGAMVNCLEMIVKFSVNILNEQDIEVPLHLTWMDGVDGKDSLDKNERDWYGLKILFILMCSPRAKDKELKYLDGFINGLEFSLESISSMSVLEIAEKIQNIGMQNKNAYYIQQAFQKIKHVYNGKIPNNAQTL